MLESWITDSWRKNPLFSQTKALKYENQENKESIFKKCKELLKKALTLVPRTETEQWHFLQNREDETKNVITENEKSWRRVKTHQISQKQNAEYEQHPCLLHFCSTE